MEVDVFRRITRVDFLYNGHFQVEVRVTFVVFVERATNLCVPFKMSISRIDLYNSSGVSVTLLGFNG